jgi:hypothetical protein
LQRKFRDSAFFTWAVVRAHRSGFNWLCAQGEANLQPRRCRRFNMAHQQVEDGPVSAYGLVIARLPLIADRLTQGNLVEPSGEGARIGASYACCQIVPSNAERDTHHELLFDWIRDEAAPPRGSERGLPTVT